MKTSRIISLARVFLNYAVLSVLLFFLFRWLDFSVLQSFALAALVGIGYDAHKTVSFRARAAESFSPYRVVVEPKFAELLVDYRLLKDSGQVDSLHALWEKKEQKLICFTVLTLRASWEWLIYSDTDKYFLSEMDLEEPFVGIAFRTSYGELGDSVFLRDPTEPDDRFHRRSPSFYFRQSMGDFEVGLKVPDSWWRETCGAHPNEAFAKTQASYNSIIGEARLTIAKIPFPAFALFHIDGGDYRQVESAWGAMDGQLASSGWKRHERDPADQPSDPWIRIENKYFHVRYTEI